MLDSSVLKCYSTEHYNITIAKYKTSQQISPPTAQVFAKAAKKCNSYAKALHYTEKDFLQQEPGTLVELLRINNTLQQPKAALGVLKYAQMNPSKLNTPEDSW